MNFSLILLWALFVGNGNKPEINNLKINQIQVLGSHNSYKMAMDTALFSALSKMSNEAKEIDYHHIPMSQQLEMGLRKLEIDVIYDPNGGRYAKPMGLNILKSQGKPVAAYDPEGKMSAPGFKVLHIQDIDFRSSCNTLTDCLQEIKVWSDAHPQHLPIVISFNAKEDRIERPGFTQPLRFTRKAFDSLDAEILTVFDKRRLITPDEVRGTYASLEQAVLAQNWPTLAQSRGKIMLVLDEDEPKLSEYIAGHPSLKGRLMFVNRKAGTPESAFIFYNDPIANQAEIREMVKKGYLVRTRSDSGTLEARKGDYTRHEAAVTSGAQFISTDYYLPDLRFGTGYRVTLPGGVYARCNPLLVNEACPGKLE